MTFLALRYLLRVQSQTPYKNFNKTKVYMISYINHQIKFLRPDIFCKLISLNLIIFGRNESNFGKKKMLQWMVNCSLLTEVCKTHLPDSFLLLCYTNVKFNWIIKRYSKFVSEAYLSNLSLDEHQMPHNLQSGHYAYWKRHNLKDNLQLVWKDPY